MNGTLVVIAALVKAPELGAEGSFISEVVYISRPTFVAVFCMVVGMGFEGSCVPGAELMSTAMFIAVLCIAVGTDIVVETVAVLGTAVLMSGLLLVSELCMAGSGISVVTSDSVPVSIEIVVVS